MLVFCSLLIHFVQNGDMTANRAGAGLPACLDHQSVWMAWEISCPVADRLHTEIKLMLAHTTGFLARLWDRVALFDNYGMFLTWGWDSHSKYSGIVCEFPDTTLMLATGVGFPPDLTSNPGAWRECCWENICSSLSVLTRRQDFCLGGSCNTSNCLGFLQSLYQHHVRRSCCLPAILHVLIGEVSLTTLKRHL